MAHDTNQHHYDDLGPCLIVPDVTRNPRGYGTVRAWRHGVRVNYRHRLAWIDHHGHLPTDDAPIIRHRCDNPPCEEPAHLVAGTRADNNHDMATRGRARAGGKGGGPAVHRRGEDHPEHTLTDAQVTEIRRLRAEEGLTYQLLADRFGTSFGYVGKIIRGDARAKGSGIATRQR